MKTKLIVCAALVSWSAYAGNFIPISLPTLDADIRTWTDGSAYGPLFPSTRTLGGVPFELQEDANHNSVFYSGPPGTAVAVLEIPVGVFGVESAFSLINTAFGRSGFKTGSLEFLGSGGLTYALDLIAGENVRDHYFGGFENNLSDPTTVPNVWGDPAYGHAHLDMQTINLPGAFHSATLEKIVFTSESYQNTPNPYGKAFLAGLTVETKGANTVPEFGSSCLLLLLSLGLTELCRRMRRT